MLQPQETVNSEHLFIIISFLSDYVNSTSGLYLNGIFYFNTTTNKLFVYFNGWYQVSNFM